MSAIVFPASFQQRSNIQASKRDAFKLFFFNFTKVP